MDCFSYLYSKVSFHGLIDTQRLSQYYNLPLFQTNLGVLEKNVFRKRKKGFFIWMIKLKSENIESIIYLFWAINDCFLSTSIAQQFDVFLKKHINNKIFISKELSLDENSKCVD
jgi:hypothetical protein